MSEPFAKVEPPNEIQIPLSRFTRFVRQLSHDLRNHLNAAELQSAYLAEIAEDPEVKEEIKRLRAMVSTTGSALQKLTATLSPVKLTVMPYGAGEFIEDLRQKLTAVFPSESSEVAWSSNIAPGATLEVDPQVLQPALIELFANAFRHRSAIGPISARGDVESESFVFRLLEPKSEPIEPGNGWGHEPLRSVGHGHYGLGLHRARTIVESHGGQLEALFDSANSKLVTTVRLPLSHDAT